MLSTLRSFRGAKVEEVIGWQGQRTEIACSIGSVSDTEVQARLQILFSAVPKPTKSALVNGKPVKSAVQFLSRRFGQFELSFHSIAFNPADHELIAGGPAGRRAYLNQVLAAENPSFLGVLQRYQRLIDQRNVLLKSGNAVERSLAAFDAPWIDLAAVIVRERLEWLGRLNLKLPERIAAISPVKADVAALYCSSGGTKDSADELRGRPGFSTHFSGQDSLPSLEVLKRVFSNRLESLRALEQCVGTTLLGPHRDDWRFHWIRSQVEPANTLGPPLRGHGSQGEIRTILLAMKLVEIDLYRERTGHRPVLLVDDFSSELDQERRGCLLRFLSESDLQVFVTSTEEAFGTGKRFCVRAGRAEEEHGATGQPERLLG